MKLKWGILLFAAFPAGLLAQSATVQMQCHTLASSGNYLAPDETYVNGMACKPVQGAQASSATAAQPASAAPTAPATPTQNPAMQATAYAPADATTATPPVSMTAAPTATKPDDGKVRLFVTDEPKDESIFLAAHASGWQASAHPSGYVSGSGGSAGAAYGYSQKGADPRTVELQADLYKACPSIVVTDDPAKGDYVLLFRREGGKRSQMFIFGGLTGLALSAHSKVDGASVFNRNGDLVYATRERTVEKAMNEVCGHLK